MAVGVVGLPMHLESEEERMREILFKAKLAYTGEWVEGYIYRQPPSIQMYGISQWWIHIPPVDPDDEGGVFNVDPETVGQYTGMNDKNGKKIFENDQFIIGDAIYKVEYIAPKYVLQNIFSCDIISLENNSKKGYIKSGQRSN